MAAVVIDGRLFSAEHKGEGVDACCRTWWLASTDDTRVSLTRLLVELVAVGVGKRTSRTRLEDGFGVIAVRERRGERGKRSKLAVVARERA